MDYTMIMNTVNAIAENFGEDAFTNKDWEAVRTMINDAQDWNHQVPTINTLRKNKLVKIVKEEEFTIEKETGRNVSYACNDKEEKIMEWHEYRNLSTATKKIVDTSTNGGKALHYVDTNGVETISAKRYYYKFNTEGIDIIRKALQTQINEYKAKLAEGEQTMKAIEEQLQSATAELSKMAEGKTCIGIGIGIVM